MKVNFSVIEKVVGTIRTLFWKNPDIIYINSNKKKFNKRNIDSNVETLKSKWVCCQTDSKLGIKFEKYHFRKMKFCLFQIMRNLSNISRIVYSGYASPMFAVYDGFCLGDNRDYVFVDTLENKNKSYIINYRKKYEKETIYFDNPSEEINVLIESSCEILVSKCRNCKTYQFNKKCKDKIDIGYLNDVYSFTKSIFDLAADSLVKKINLYVSARQPVSFIVGTAIQSSHPSVYVYEFDQGQYKDLLLVQEGRIIEGKNDRELLK